MLQCGWTFSLNIVKWKKPDKKIIFEYSEQVNETVKSNVCQGLGNGSDSLMGAAFLSGWWKSSGFSTSGRCNGCSVLMNELHAVELVSEMVNFMLISPPPPGKTPPTRILFYIIWNRSPLRQCGQHKILCQHHCILVSWVTTKPRGLEQVSSTLQTSGVSFPCMKRRSFTRLF